MTDLEKNLIDVEETSQPVSPDETQKQTAETSDAEKIPEVCPYCWNPNIMLGECMMCGGYFEILPKEILDEIKQLPWIKSDLLHVVESKDKKIWLYKEKFVNMLKSLFRKS